jgi:hypothetical protein
MIMILSLFSMLMKILVDFERDMIVSNRWHIESGPHFYNMNFLEKIFHELNFSLTLLN